MKTRNDARERALDLAFKHESVCRIAEILEEEGLGDLLEQTELEAIVIEAESIRKLIPERPGKTLPRIIGIIAVLIGSVGIWIGNGGLPVSRYSPGGYGFVAVVLGAILIFKPSKAYEDL